MFLFRPLWTLKVAQCPSKFDCSTNLRNKKTRKALYVSAPVFEHDSIHNKWKSWYISQPLSRKKKNSTLYPTWYLLTSKTFPYYRVYVSPLLELEMRWNVIKKNVHKTLSFPYLQSASLKLYIKWSGRFFTNVFLSFSRFVHGRSIDIFRRYSLSLSRYACFSSNKFPSTEKLYRER